MVQPVYVNQTVSFDKPMQPNVPQRKVSIPISSADPKAGASAGMDPQTVHAVVQVVVMIQQGSLKLANGTYEGDIKDGKPHGHGTLTYNPGENQNRIRYTGQFSEGLRHGEGEVKCKNGVYKGEFVQDLLNGPGSYVSGDRSETYVGTFKNGFYSGNGTYTSKGSYTYTGEFEKDRANGRGKLVQENGTIFEGQFKDDTVHGHAIQTVPMRAGNGYQWNMTYEGNFQNGKKNGNFRVTSFGNQVSHKEYVNGVEQTCCVIS